RALGGRHDGPPRTLEAGHGGVPVDADQEDVTQRPCLAEVAHVADVEEIEAAVGEDQPFALAPPVLGQPCRLVKTEERRHRRQSIRTAPAEKPSPCPASSPRRRRQRWRATRPPPPLRRRRARR